jgi:tRNA 5-methylaminomethyl-2-thiouridine biosynthesis bifunctional protein
VRSGSGSRPVPPAGATARAPSGPPATVAAARLAFRGDVPYSLDFGDIYHAADGVAEVERVFLVPTRFAERAAQTRSWLRVGELGFGSALNFITAAERFLDLAPAAGRMHFLSCDAHPLDPVDFARIADARGGRQPLYRELARVYPPRLPGWHRRELAAGRVRLSLYYGDAATALADLDRRAPPFDVWFLDGFAPDRNAGMWTPDLLRAVAACCATGAAVATFTAAGAVRRRLEAAGFAVERLDQRPHKRHTLRALFTGNRSHRPLPRRVVVAGAGLAGAFAARALADAGIDVVVVDAPAPRLPEVVLHSRALAEGSAHARLRNNAYLNATATYASIGIHPTGALQLASSTTPLARLDRIALTFASTGRWVVRCDPVSASALAGLRVQTGALYFPDAVRVPTEDLCDALLAGVERRFERVVSCSPRADTCSVTTTQRNLDADAIVLCTGTPPHWPALRHLEVLPVWGQLEVLKTGHPPRLPLFADGYLVPRADGTVALGATYEQAPWNAERATAENLARYARFTLTASGRDAQWTARFRGVRGVSSDRLPVVGRASDDGPLWVDLAHGSNATATAPLAAALIAEGFGGEFAPMGNDEIALLDPLRFLERQARRGPRHGARSARRRRS